MKNITLSADEKLIQQARKQATAEGTTLNEQFRVWLKQYTLRQQSLAAFDAIMDGAPYFTSQRKYTRDEMNER